MTPNECDVCGTLISPWRRKCKSCRNRINARACLIP